MFGKNFITIIVVLVIGYALGALYPATFNAVRAQTGL